MAVRLPPLADLMSARSCRRWTAARTWTSWFTSRSSWTGLWRCSVTPYARSASRLTGCSRCGGRWGCGWRAPA
eukprot:128448-Chlamydomonas_euryale.AAC.1